MLSSWLHGIAENPLGTCCSIEASLSEFIIGQKFLFIFESQRSNLQILDLTPDIILFFFLSFIHFFFRQECISKNYCFYENPVRQEIYVQKFIKQKENIYI